MHKLFRQCKPLSPRVTSLQLRYPGVTRETRERAFPVIRSAWERAFPLRAVAIVFLGQFDKFISTIRHSAMSPILPSICVPWRRSGSSPFAKQQYEHVSWPGSARVVDCVSCADGQQ